MTLKNDERVSRPRWYGIAILNVYAPNNRALKYVKQKLTELKGGRQFHNYIP